MQMTAHIVTIGFLLGTIIISSMSEIIPDISGPEVICIDIDGNSYRTVQIGKRVWMAENLRVRHYRNTDPITERTHDQFDLDANNLWKATVTGAFAKSSEVGADVRLNGLLYNWYALNDWRGLCPIGWRVPTDDDWCDLESAAGVPPGMLRSDSPTRGEKENALVKLEELQFNLRLSGAKYGTGWDYRVGSTGQYWSKTEFEDNSAWFRLVNVGKNGIERSTADKFAGLSCRCVKE